MQNTKKAPGMTRVAGVEDIDPSKLKKELELVDGDAAPIDKIEEEDAFESDEGSEELSDEAGFDGEELNPFGDKWEE